MEFSFSSHGRHMIMVQQHNHDKKTAPPSLFHARFFNSLESFCLFRLTLDPPPHPPHKNLTYIKSSSSSSSSSSFCLFRLTLDPPPHPHKNLTYIKGSSSSSSSSSSSTCILYPKETRRKKDTKIHRLQQGPVQLSSSL